MSARFGQLHQNFQNVWVTNSGAVAGAVKLRDLSPEQVGIFPADEYCSGESVSVVTPSFKKNKRFVIAQGIAPFEGQQYPYSTRQFDVPRQSVQFTKDEIVSWKGLKAKRGAATQAIAIGYDGLNANKSMTANLDTKPVTIRVILSGEPIRKFFGARDGKIMREYTIDKGLCVGDCNCVDTCGKVPCQTIADGFINAIEKDKWNGVAISEFMRLSKIQKCENAPAEITKKEYKEYTVSVCDDGSSTLGYIANQTGLSVKMTNRVDSVSTYSVWLPTADPAPSDVTITGSVAPNCKTCPTGYTSVSEAHVYDIKVNKGVSVPALPGQLSVTKLGSDGKTDSYVALLALTWNDDADDGTTPEVAVDTDAVDALLEPVATSYTYLGTKSQICVSDTTQTLEFEESGEKLYSTTKEYMITLGDTVCGDSRLVDLQKAYPELTITEEATAANCMHAFKTSTESDLVSLEDCGKIERYTFTPPVDFEAIQWYDYAAVQADPNCEDPAEAAPECCACGVVIEGVVFKKFYKECTYGWYDWHPNDVLPVNIQVTAHSHDYTNNLCDESKDYVTVLRQASLNRGTSGEVVQEYERDNLLYENKRWNPNPWVNELNGFQISAKPHLMYDTYVLTLKRRGYDNNYILEDQSYVDYVFYVKENEGKQLETLINSLVLSTGREDLNAVVL